jgi:hypothetical protein
MFLTDISRCHVKNEIGKDGKKEKYDKRIRATP